MARNTRQKTTPTRSRQNTSLPEALKECQRAARRGYKEAKANLLETGGAVQMAAGALGESLAQMENSTVRTNSVTAELRQQYTKVIQELEELQASAERKLQEKRDRLNCFSVTLFGRTMSGKSTFMEILTRDHRASRRASPARTVT